MQRDTQEKECAKVLSESAATQAMWDFYKFRKALYIPDIREYRIYIIGQLMLGVSPQHAFKQFLAGSSPALRPKKLTGPANDSKGKSLKQSPWPF